MTEPEIMRLVYWSEEELDRKLCETMRRRGYEVTKAVAERITIGELAKRVERPVSTVSRSLTRPTCPPFESLKGKRRILWIEPTEKLLAFLRTPSTGGRPREGGK